MVNVILKYEKKNINSKRKYNSNNKIKEIESYNIDKGTNKFYFIDINGFNAIDDKNTFIIIKQYKNMFQNNIIL
jgi:hypothetical protein